MRPATGPSINVSPLAIDDETLILKALANTGYFNFFNHCLITPKCPSIPGTFAINTGGLTAEFPLGVCSNSRAFDG